MIPSLVGLFGACSPANSLQGSLFQQTSLDFNTVSITLQNNQFIVDYSEAIDGGAEIPFELTVNIPGIPLDAGFDVLFDGGTATEPVAVASRNVLDDPRMFTPINAGYLNVNGPVAVGQVASGNFFVVFSYCTDTSEGSACQDNGSLGNGYVVYGNFQSKVIAQ